MKTYDQKTNEESASDLQDAMAILTATGLEAALVYDGGADRCPHCTSQVLSRAA